ncbi:MAG: DNA-deoxyinosine glycosylase [Candidatus Cryptobacteroides sp.]
MTNIQNIVQAIDALIESNKVESVDPVVANEHLCKLGLLADSQTRPGKPLRDLLRNGLLPHARKEGCFWKIPHSNLKGSKSQDLCNSQPKNIVSSLPPLIGSNPKILILGSMPGSTSLMKQEYYSNSSNRFWKIMTNIYGGDVPNNYQDKKKYLIEKHIALWDVYKTAVRKGSADANIEDGSFNDIIALLLSTPSIKTIILNGEKAADAFASYICINCKNFPNNVQVNVVPSSSGANKHFTTDKLTQLWFKAILTTN